jgi:hypothetical protein
VRSLCFSFLPWNVLVGDRRRERKGEVMHPESYSLGLLPQVVGRIEGQRYLSEGYLFWDHGGGAQISLSN